MVDMNNLTSLFIELIQVALGRRNILSKEPSNREWYNLYDMCQRQAVQGVAFLGVNVLHQKGYNIPQQLKFDWIISCQQIESQNLIINKYAIDIAKFFSSDGFKCCLIKGQGNAQMYTNPLSREPGDIDMWLWGEKEKICNYVCQYYPNANACGWHIDFPKYDNIPVEVHFTPGYNRNPFFDKRLQLYFKQNATQQFSHEITLQGINGKINVPIFEFNLVLQLSHVLRHFMIEGIGLRHMMDLYYLLMCSDNDILQHAEIEKKLKYLGLARFASAVMWIMLNVFQLEENRLILEPNRKRGVLLFDEIINGGNFGRHDKRKRCRKSKIWSLYPFVSRAIRFSCSFPEEALFTPIYRRVHLKNVCEDLSFV